MGAEEETEEGLDTALRASEDDAERQYHRQLQEAQLESILLSKSTHTPLRSAESDQDGMSLVLLLFTHFPKEFRNALLNSPLALRLSSEGVELQPPFACPRLVLAEGVNDRFVVPTGVSLFDIDSSLNAMGKVDGESLSFCPSTELGKLIIKNTF